jgi:UDP-glucose 4-epimerase
MSETDDRPVLLLGANSRLAGVFAHEKGSAFALRKVARIAPGEREENAFYGDYRCLELPLFEGCRAVINFTGVASGPLEEVNVGISIAAARVARAAGVPHFVQISSLSVYGGAEHIGLNTTENPKSAYGASKLCADRELAAFATDDFGVTILRVPVLYGAHSSGKIGALARFMVRTGFFPAPRPLPRRSVLHVVNAVEALAHVVETRPLGIRLAADHDPFDLVALAAAVGAAHGRAVRLIEVPSFAFQPAAYFTPVLYNSLFRSSLIEPNDSLTKEISLPVTLEIGLNALVERLGDKADS